MSKQAQQQQEEYTLTLRRVSSDGSFDTWEGTVSIPMDLLLENKYAVHILDWLNEYITDQIVEALPIDHDNGNEVSNYLEHHPDYLSMRAACILTFTVRLTTPRQDEDRHVITIPIRF